MAVGHAVTKPQADKCHSLCKLISNSMHVKVMVALFATKSQLDAIFQFSVLVVV